MDCISPYGIEAIKAGQLNRHLSKHMSIDGGNSLCWIRKLGSKPFRWHRLALLVVDCAEQQLKIGQPVGPVFPIPDDQLAYACL